MYFDFVSQPSRAVVLFVRYVPISHPAACALQQAMPFDKDVSKHASGTDAFLSRQHPTDGLDHHAGVRPCQSKRGLWRCGKASRGARSICS